MRDDPDGRELDRVWNELAAGRDVAATQLEPAVEQILRALHAPPPPFPDGFGAATDRAVAAALARPATNRTTNKETVMNGIALDPTVHAPELGYRPAPRRSRVRTGWRRVNAGYVYVLTVLLMIASLGGLFAASQTDRTFQGGTPLHAPGDPPLYRIAAADGSWQQLDQTTLAVLPGQSGPALPELQGFGDYRSRFLLDVSADGSTVAQLLQKAGTGSPLDRTVVFYNVHAKTQLAAIPIDETSRFSNFLLSADGHSAYRLLTAVSPNGVLPPVTGLDVLDTTSGALVQHVDFTAGGAKVLGLPVVDPTGTRVYALTIPTGSQTPTGAVTVAAYDLATGLLRTQAVVPAMIPVDDATPSAANVAVLTHRPALTLSADGRTLTLVSPGVDRLVHIATASFTQSETPVGTADGAACVGPTEKVDEIAASAEVNGRIVVAMWTTVSLPASLSSRGDATGLCSINAATGAAVMQPAAAMLPAGWSFGAPILSSNGAHVYVTGYSGTPALALGTPQAVPDGFGLFALDATTLDPQGHQVFTQTEQAASGGYFLTETWPH